MPSRGGRQQPALRVKAARLILLSRFQERSGLDFKDPGLLDRALTHSSYTNESVAESGDNETLEFLGDAVLGQAVAHFLFRSLQGWGEGDLSRAKGTAVSETALAAVAEKLGVAEYLLMGKGEELSGGRKKRAILADCLEALIAAVFLDSGYQAAADFVERILADTLASAIAEPGHDFKSMLQEQVQKTRGAALPVYSIIKVEGPQHVQTFTVECTMHDGTSSRGRGSTRKAAEQEAAETMLGMIASKS